MIADRPTITGIEDAHTSGVYPKRPLTLVRGEGCTLYDDAGTPYLDAASGQGVALLGHGHPAVAEAVTAQAQTMITCPEIFYNDRRAELYTELLRILPPGLVRFFLCNSGAEAVEGALKVARLLTERTGFVATMRGFHGRTMGALSLTWNPKYRKAFKGWTVDDDVTHISYNDLDAAAKAITENTAAVVIEAVQGEGGVYPADIDYLRGLRDLCRERGALLVVDEIQAGLGRTGRWFGFEHAGIIPDVVTLGKGLAGGVPMGAVVWRGDQIPRGSHGSTFGGNPLSSAAAIATLRALRDEDLVANAAAQGEFIMGSLREMHLDPVREVRGRGLLIGLELRGRVTPVLKDLQARGVIALPAGLNVLRLLPPLIITREEAQRLVETVAASLTEAS